MRDPWFICLPAAACIADFPPRSHHWQVWTIGWQELAPVCTGAVILLLVAAPAVDFNSRGLDRAISNEVPVNAINYLRRNPVPGRSKTI